MPGVIAAATGSDWNAGGSILTFFAPAGLFVVVAAILYMLFSRPHRRVPGHRDLASAHAAEASVGAAGAGRAGSGLPAEGATGDSPESGA